LLEVCLPHTLNIITKNKLEETAYKLSILTLKDEAFSCKDGNSPVAGGICDWRLSEEALREGLNVNEYLRNNDTYTLLSKLKRAIITGPTGTNVNDLVVIAVVPT